MKPVLRFLILLFVIALGQQSFAYSWNKVDMQEDLLATNCQLSELQMDITVCNDSIFVAEVSFVADNPNPFGYNVLIDGVFYTFNQYEDTLAQSFVIEFIDPDLGTEILVEVFDEGDITCATEAEFLIECEETCHIGTLDIVVLDCDTATNTFAVELDFEYDNVESAQFEVHGNGTHYGTFQYTDLPITIGGFEGDTDFVYELIVYDFENETCSSGYSFFGPVDCSDACDIDATEYEIVDCNPIDSTFYVNVWFEYANIDSLTVSIFGGGYDWGEFDAWEQPMTLGPYYGDQGVYEVVIQDTYDPECFDVLTVDSPSCLNTDCQLSALEIDIEYCSDSLVFLDASFLAENTASPVYNIILNGEFYSFGLYSDSNNEQTFEFAIEDPQFGSLYTLEIVDEDDVSCAIAIEFVLEPCSNECTIDGVNYAVVDCNPSDSTYYVNVWFDYYNADPLTVSIFGSGYDWGEFDAWEQPMQLGPFYGAEGVPEQIIQNVNEPSCSTEFGIDSPSCFYTDCYLDITEYNIVECNQTDSTFYVELYINHENLEGDAISIYGGGYDWGIFDPNTQPIIVGPYFSGQMDYEIIVADQLDSLCNSYVGFGPVDCSDACEIEAVEYEIVDCNPLDSTFYINVWFEYDNLDSLTVSIFGGGYDWGEFDAWEQPIQLGPFYGDQDVYEVVIQDTYDSECFDVLAVDSPNCLYTDCYVDITDYTIECIGEDSIFYVELFIEVANLSSDSISVFGGGYDWGEFAAGLESITVGPYFAGDGVYEILISDSSNPDCISFVEFEEPDCSDACDIDIVEYNIVECSETDSIFYLEVFFEYDNLLGDAVSIFGGGYNWGIYNPLLQPILIGPFFTGDLEYEIIVADQLDLDCFDVVGFEFNGCNEECELIEEIWLENGPDCLGDLCEIEIGVDLSQAGAGLPVDIHLDGFSYFDYPVSQLAGQSFTFVQDSLEFSSVVVCISGSFDCCDTLYFDVPPTAVGDVWPGDANSDNIANNIDLLYIGLANGFQGFDRPEQGIEWEAYESDDWDFFFPESGVNFKHADSNGDGLVDEADIEAIEENYGLTHGAYDPDFEIGGPSDPPLYIDLPSYVQPDQLIEAEIVLGEFSNQVSDLYGIAFTVEFPDGIFQNNEIEFDSTGSWIGGIDADMYTFSRDANGVFEVDITLVRKDQSNAGTNYGRIGNFIGVIDDVLGLQEASVKIKNVVAISNDETLIQLNLPVDTMIISSSDQILEDDKIHVYPVPTNKFLYLETDIAEDVSSMEIITLDGVRVRHYDHFESRLDLKELHNGVYLLRVRTAKGIYQERIMIFN